jgi:hypothetical protein
MKAILAIIFATACSAAIGQNIDPYGDGSKYAYSENTGWVNFKPTYGEGITVHGGKVSGYAWNENIGWINFSPANYGGVSYDTGWNLFGYAWAENAGWIWLNPTYGGVKIDADGNFSGWAWGENIGWIHFASASPVSYKVRACVVGLDDLANFVEQWLITSRETLAADIDGNHSVNFRDFGRFAANWCNFCADGWLLK